MLYEKVFKDALRHAELLVIQRKCGNTSNVPTTGNSYQYSRLLQIHQKCAVCGIRVTNITTD